MTAPGASAPAAEMLTAVLRHFDWSPASKAPGRYEIWTPEDSDDDQVLMPLDPSRGDYIALLERAQRTILAQYGRAARELLDTIEMRARTGLDSTQWTKETSLAAGVIPWEDGETLYSSARSQLVASAKSARQKRRYHGSASAYLAKQLLDNTLMGQTDVGSFIITAYTPANSRLYLSKHSEELRWSNPRKAESIASEEILLTFENALRAIRSVLDEHKGRPRTDSFLETVDEGVSFEFARALSQFTSHSESAIRILRQEGSERSAEFAFTPVESPVIEKAANLLALDPEPQDVTLVGEVTLLSRSVAGQDQLIRLNIEEGADVRKARIRLSAEQYEIAMEAHRREASLQVSGRLEKEGKLYWLYEPTNVSIVEGSESELPLREDTSHPTLFEF